MYYDGGQFVGLSVGKGDIRFRLYDKLSEAAAAGTLARWRDVWGYNGSDPIWRFEYQLRGDFLRQFGIETLPGFMSVLGDIFDYLFSWLRFASTSSRHDVDRPLLPWWRDFMGLVFNCGFSRLGAGRDILPKFPDIEGLSAQLVGIAASYAAASAFVNGTGFDVDEIIGLTVDLLLARKGVLASAYIERLAKFEDLAYA
jgi:hypothetical protein